MAFTFKQFHIDDLGCGMPVSTDAVILGALAPLEQAKQLLDIGAGSGILSLMAAQRCHAQITAVEIDPIAFKACQHNCSVSAWHSRIEILNTSIEHYLTQQSRDTIGKKSKKFDHIICNPPYFEYGPKAKIGNRALARHTDSLTFTTLLHCIEQLLTPTGIASLILPITALTNFNKVLQQSKLIKATATDIIPRANKTTNRQVFCLRFPKEGTQDSSPKLPHTLQIRDSDNHYTPQMKQLTKEFYLKI